MLNRLTLIEPLNEKSKSNHRLGLYQCKCGIIHKARIDLVKRGTTRSCGCLAKELSSKREKTHGMTRSPIYRSWESMKSRCYREHDQDYHLYGGRGIKVCDRWLNSFENFYEDMGPKPSRKHTIDRKNTNGDYSPENCIWSNIISQNNNRRNNVFITYDNKTMTIAEWARSLNVSHRLIHSRYQSGWSTERMLTYRIKNEK